MRINTVSESYCSIATKLITPPTIGKAPLSPFIHRHLDTSVLEYSTPTPSFAARNNELFVGTMTVHV